MNTNKKNPAKERSQLHIIDNNFNFEVGRAGPTKVVYTFPALSKVQTSNKKRNIIKRNTCNKKDPQRYI